MGIITRFLFGSVLGATFVITMDDFYYRVIKRNIADPVRQDFKQDEVDMIKVSKTITSGLKLTYKELYP